ncbi:MAG: crossover junction endodeoxyribonuclease RuvC [Rhodospirillales bacterium]|nr:crossover junction endodeoxyribonuclease RuvC [Rhodospirillales bacterium]
MRILGLDPGLQHTGWGVIDIEGNSLRHVAHGVISPAIKAAMAERLTAIYDGVVDVLNARHPDGVAIEETFVNRNPDSTLKLGLARGAALVASASTGLPVAEYAARLVKKSVVGTGKADKDQIAAMVAMLLPDSGVKSADAADALAVAICHAHHAETLGPQRRLTAAVTA